MKRKKQKPSERVMELVGIECCLPNRKAENFDYIRAILQVMDEQSQNPKREE